MTDVLLSTSEPQVRQTRGRVPISQILLNGTKFDITVVGMTANFDTNNHDYVLMSCSSSTLTNLTGIKDSPITFVWGQAPRTVQFVGYVELITETDSGQGNLSFDMIVFGATRGMRTSTPRFWSNKTIPSAISDLVNINGLGFIGSPHSVQWQGLAQTGETDWATIIGFAKRLGWPITYQNGVVQCFDPLAAFTGNGAFAVLKASNDKDYDPTSARRLLEFTPSDSSNVSPDQQGIRVSYFNDAGKVLIDTQKGNFSAYSYKTAVPVRNEQEAAVHLQASANEVDMWPHQGTVRVWGDSDIYPGMLVDIATQDRTFVRNGFNGRWFVKGVKHVLDTTSFQTELTVARPTDTGISLTPYQSFWERAGKPKPNMVLSNGQWISSWCIRSIGALYQ